MKNSLPLTLPCRKSLYSHCKLEAERKRANQVQIQPFVDKKKENQKQHRFHSLFVTSFLFFSFSFLNLIIKVKLQSWDYAKAKGNEHRKWHGNRKSVNKIAAHRSEFH